jgi:quercetin dioxygenase-like cupin family protein
VGDRPVPHGPLVACEDRAVPHTAYDLVHLDDFERPFPMWALARRSLNISSFGMNVVELPPGEMIPEHDEVERDHEEVFITLSGSPTVVIDGQDLPAPAGTFCRLDPEPQRTVRNDGDDVATVLIVSAPRTSGYEPMDWA